MSQGYTTKLHKNQVFTTALGASQYDGFVFKYNPNSEETKTYNCLHDASIKDYLRKYIYAWPESTGYTKTQGTQAKSGWWVKYKEFYIFDAKYMGNFPIERTF